MIIKHYYWYEATLDALGLTVNVLGVTEADILVDWYSHFESVEADALRLDECITYIFGDTSNYATIDKLVREDDVALQETAVPSSVHPTDKSDATKYGSAHKVALTCHAPLFLVGHVFHIR
jgi:hypothetical protein